MMLWLCVLYYLVGVKIYLASTPAKTQRLRQISYERQLESGFKHLGKASLASD
jgi:hypothetical protein